METEIIDSEFSHLIGELLSFKETAHGIPFYFLEEIKDKDQGIFVPKTFAVTQGITNSLWSQKQNNRIYPKLGCMFWDKDCIGTNKSPGFGVLRHSPINQDTQFFFLGAYRKFSFHVPFVYKIKSDLVERKAEYQIDNSIEHNLGHFKNGFYNQQHKTNNLNVDILEDDIAFENFGTIYNSIAFIFLHPELNLILVPIDKNEVTKGILTSSKEYFWSQTSK